MKLMDNNTNPQSIVKTSTKAFAQLIEQILPFKEFQPDETLLKNSADDNEDHANELFGYFTANIIKENVTFIR